MTATPEQPLATVQLQVDHDTVHAVIVGELDMSNATQIVTGLEEACAGAHALTLDIAAVTFLDSHGIAQLFRLNSHLLRTGHKLRVITGTATPVARVLDLTGMNLIFTIEQHKGVAPAPERSPADYDQCAARPCPGPALAHGPDRRDSTDRSRVQVGAVAGSGPLPRCGPARIEGRP
jgi:anti-anti-sigma factor